VYPVTALGAGQANVFIYRPWNLSYNTLTGGFVRLFERYMSIIDSAPAIVLSRRVHSGLMISGSSIIPTPF
jgi:hypothetical protein